MLPFAGQGQNLDTKDLSLAQIKNDFYALLGNQTGKCVFDKITKYAADKKIYNPHTNFNLAHWYEEALANFIFINHFDAARFAWICDGLRDEDEDHSDVLQYMECFTQIPSVKKRVCPRTKE